MVEQNFSSVDVKMLSNYENNNNNSVICSSQK